MATCAGTQHFPVEGATSQTITGGVKPLHRFLRGEPKSVGVVIMFLGLCLFMFGIPLKKERTIETSSDIYCSFWLGILYFTCGILYLLAEREPTKKIVTASLALSIISVIGTVVSVIRFINAMVFINYFHIYHMYRYTSEMENNTDVRNIMIQHYISIYNLEAVFLFHSVLGGVILITMAVFARQALRSSRTQTVVIMRNLPAATE